MRHVRGARPVSAPPPDTRARRGRLRDRARACLVLGTLSAGAAAAAWTAALMGIKSMAAGAAVLVFVAVLVVFRRREDLVLVTAVLSLAVVVRKSLGPLTFVPSGAPGFYISSFDVLLALLYGMWAFGGTMGRDLRQLMRQRVMWMPLVGALCLLPSLAVARRLDLAAAELARLGGAYLLFVYFAARIRSRRQVRLVLGALGAIAVLELVVVLGQKVTGGPLGLSFLGTPTTMVAGRVTAEGVLNRPFGTINHPVFLAAFLSQIGLLALALGLGLRRGRRRLMWLGVAAAATLPLLISQTRAAVLGMAIAMPVLVIWGLVTGRLRWRVLAAVTAIAIVVAALASPQLLSLYRNNFHTDHFGVELDSRSQLNQVGRDMFFDSPLIGHGLNNFQAAAPPYETGDVIFAGNPVHNIYLLELAETGVVGFVGAAIVSFALLGSALKLARSRDRLYSAIGAAVAASYLFFAVEEMLLFAVRQSAPMTLLWLLAGLVVACRRLAAENGTSGPDRKRHRHRPAPPRGPLRPRVVGQRAQGVPLRSHARNGARAVHRRAGALSAHVQRPFALLAAGSVGAVRAVRRVVVVTIRAVDGSSAPGPRSRGGRPWKRLGGVALVAMVVVSRLAFADADVTPTPFQPRATGLDVLVAGADRSTGRHGIYRLVDGRPVKISPDDGLDYFWPEWAMGGTKIVFSARSGPEGVPEQLYLMNPDGTGRVQLTSNPWRNQQPKVSPDGRSVVFTSSAPEYQHIGLYRLDLETLEVASLSSATGRVGAFDADPRWSADGSRIVFANTIADDLATTVPTQVDTMAPDGTDRRHILTDDHYNVDPALSSDGRWLTTSSYRGGGNPRNPGSEVVEVKLGGWFIPVVDLANGTERVLNRGEACAERPATQPCAPGDGAAWNPLWAPDDSAVGYISALSSASMCVCVAQADGSGTAVLFQTSQLALTWFDWTVRTGAPAGAITQPGRALPTDALLLSGTAADGSPLLAVAGPDRWVARPLPLPDGYVLRSARWDATRDTIVVEASAPPGDEAIARNDVPPGAVRQRHFTLDLLDRIVAASAPDDEASPASQIFVATTGGPGLQRVTTPATEDWRDAVPDGELRANVDPDISPDGRYVVTTNVSPTGESAILRVDLQTGAVLNLTNGTAGAVAVTDRDARFSPDGSTIVFTSGVGDTRQLFLMDVDGLDVRQLTDDDHVNRSPAWSPDGASIVYSSYRGDAATPQLVRLDLASRTEAVLSAAPGRGAFAPAWSPDGSSIAYLSATAGGQLDVWIVGADGVFDRPLQVTQRINEVSVDWR